MSDILQRVAAKAVIIYNGKLLLLREASTYEEGTNIGKWHLPGGRINPGESYHDGLRREVMEEAGLTIREIGLPVYVGEWSPVIKGVQNQIFALFSVCYVDSDVVQLSQEHDAFKWFDVGTTPDVEVMGPEDKVLARVAEFKEKGVL